MSDAANSNNPSQKNLSWLGHLRGLDKSVHPAVTQDSKPESPAWLRHLNGLNKSAHPVVTERK